MSTQPAIPEKSPFEIALIVADLVNTYGPGIIDLVARIKKDDGSIETVDLLARAREKVQSNIDRANAALESE